MNGKRFVLCKQVHAGAIVVFVTYTKWTHMQMIIFFIYSFAIRNIHMRGQYPNWDSINVFKRIRLCLELIKFYSLARRDSLLKKNSWLGSKNDMRSLVNFKASSDKSEIFFLMCYFCQYHIKFQLKSTEELSLVTPKKDPNFEGKLTFYLKNFVDFNLSSVWKFVWKFAL